MFNKILALVAAVPEWCNFFTKEEYVEFIHQVGRFIDSTGYKNEFLEDNSLIVLHFSEDPKDKLELGVTNLAQLCHQAERSEWPKIIKSHFETLINSSKNHQGIEHFEDIKDDLVIRFQNDTYVQSLPEGTVIFQNLAPNLNAVLTHDLPEVMKSVNDKDIERMGVPLGELFHIAKLNTLNKVQSEIQNQKLGEVEFTFAFSDDFFSSSIFYQLEERDLLGEYGSLIAFPTRHITIIYKINSIEVVQAVQNILPLLYSMFNEGPGSISTNLYWFNENELIDLPNRIDEGDNQLAFVPPVEFIELLNKLAAK